MWRSPFGAQTYMLPAIALLGVMGALLLLVVCANVSNLVLVRGVSRRGEIAARIALGASRGRILRLLLVESLVLSLPGAALGLADCARHRCCSATATWRRPRRSRSSSTPRPTGRSSPSRSLLSCGSSLVFGFVPALRSSRVNLAGIMKDDLSPRGGSRGRLRDVLVVAQVAVSLLLLVGAGLVVRSLEAARTADTGFDSAQRRVGLARPSSRAATTRHVDGRSISGCSTPSGPQPGVESAALAVAAAADARGWQLGGHRRSRARIPARARTCGSSSTSSRRTTSTTLRIPSLAGRDFARTDLADAQPVAIVNETMARRFWKTPAQALGKRMRLSGGDGEAWSAWRVTSSTRA